MKIGKGIYFKLGVLAWGRGPVTSTENMEVMSQQSWAGRCDCCPPVSHPVPTFTLRLPLTLGFGFCVLHSWGFCVMIHFMSFLRQLSLFGNVLDLLSLLLLGKQLCLALLEVPHVLEIVTSTDDHKDTRHLFVRLWLRGSSWGTLCPSVTSNSVIGTD